jgi:hypothetical protein
LSDLDSGGEGETEDVSEGVGDDVGSRGFSGDVGGHGEGGDVSDTSLEFLFHVFGGDLEDGSVVELSVHVDVHDLDEMFVGLDVELFHQVDFGHGDLLSDGEDLGGRDNFELILDNLGGDLKGLEVLDLRRVHTSGTGGEGDFDGRDGSGFGLLFDDELGGDFGDLSEFFVGEDHEGLHVVDFVNDSLETFLGVVGSGALGDVLRDGLGHDSLRRENDEGINIDVNYLFSYSFTADNFGVDVSEELSDFVDHVSGEILDFTDEELSVLAKEFLDFGEDLILALLLGHLYQYENNYILKYLKKLNNKFKS